MKKKINIKNKISYLYANVKASILNYDNRKINFIIAGTQKGGTTALHHYLSSHQQISFSKIKEVHYFDYEPNFIENKINYKVYRAFFPKKIADNIMGEATPIYMWWNNAIERISEYNPSVKLIIILRNPIKRAYSHWNMERIRNEEKLDFFDAIISEKERVKISSPYQHRNFSYISRGFYYKQIKNIYKIFNPSQVLILRNKSLKNNPQETINSVCDFLEIQRLPNVTKQLIHSKKYKRAMTVDEKKYLINIFKDDIMKLERLLDWDCSEWY